MGPTSQRRNSRGHHVWMPYWLRYVDASITHSARKDNLFLSMTHEFRRAPVTVGGACVIVHRRAGYLTGVSYTIALGEHVFRTRRC